MAGKTAAEIRRRGWIQGRLYARPDASPSDPAPADPVAVPDDEWLANCAVCLVGGIAAAMFGRPLAMPPLWDSPLLAEVYARTERDASDWNDQHGRTEADVLGLLDSIASGQ